MAEFPMVTDDRNSDEGEMNEQREVTERCGCSCHMSHGGLRVFVTDCPLCAPVSPSAQEKEAACLPTCSYPVAARAIALHLDEFADESLPYAELIAECARRAAAELATLRAQLSEREAEVVSYKSAAAINAEALASALDEVATLTEQLREAQAGKFSPLTPDTMEED